MIDRLILRRFPVLTCTRGLEQLVPFLVLTLAGCSSTLPPSLVIAVRDEQGIDLLEYDPASSRIDTLVTAENDISLACFAMSPSGRFLLTAFDPEPFPFHRIGNVSLRVDDLVTRGYATVAGRVPGPGCPVDWHPFRDILYYAITGSDSIVVWERDYSHRGGPARQSFSVSRSQHPEYRLSVSPSGTKVVFQQAEQLTMFDLETKQTRRLELKSAIVEFMDWIVGDSLLVQDAFWDSTFVFTMQGVRRTVTPPFGLVDEVLDSGLGFAYDGPALFPADYIRLRRLGPDLPDSATAVAWLDTKHIGYAVPDGGGSSLFIRRVSGASTELLFRTARVVVAMVSRASCIGGPRCNQSDSIN